MAPTLLSPGRLNLIYMFFYSFDVVWDDRDSAFGELKDYKLLYFLQDDTIAIKVLYSLSLIDDFYLK